MRTPTPIPQGLLDALVYDETSPTQLRWTKWSHGRRRDLQAGRTSPGVRSQIGWEGDRFYAYRLVWALHHGDPGAVVVDHIDNDPTNNRIENLQAITKPDNTARVTGKGCSFDNRRGLWRAQVQVKGKQRFLGYFATEEEARAAYVAAKSKVTEGLNVTL